MWKRQACGDPKLRISNCPSRMHVLLKVRRRAVQSGRLAPQAAPGLGSLRSRSEDREAPEEAARPPAAGSGEGSERRARSPSQDSTTGAGGPHSSRLPEGSRRWGSQAELWKPRSRGVALRLQPPPAPPASRAAPLGPGLRSPALLAAVETMEGGRAHARPAPPPPRRVNPFAAPAARRLAAAPEVPTHPPPALRAVGGQAASSRGTSATEARLPLEPSTAGVTAKVESLYSKRNPSWGEGQRRF